MGEMVGPGRLELPTSRLSGVRSNQLSYGPFGSAQQDIFKRKTSIKYAMICVNLSRLNCEERETKAAKSRFSLAISPD